MQNKNKKRNVVAVLVIVTLIVVAFLAFCVVYALNENKPNDNDRNEDVYYSLTPGEQTVVATIRAAVASKNLEDAGGGYQGDKAAINTTTCLMMRDLALKLEPTAEWHTDTFCRSSNIIGDNETSRHLTLSLSSQSNCARYTFDVNYNILTNYEFLNTPCSGVSIRHKD